MKTLNQVLHPAFTKMSGKHKETRNFGFYSSISEFIAATREPAKWKGAAEIWEEKKRDRGSFTGCTYAEAMERVDLGWPEAVARIDTLIKEIPPTVQPITRKRKKVRGDFGEEYDIHRAWSGQLDTAWDRLEKRPTPGPAVVTIIVEHSHSAGVDKDVLFWRGAAAIALADMLETAGYNVEILNVFPAEGDRKNTKYGNGLFVQIRTKEATMPLDKSAQAGTIANAAFYRQNFFMFAFCQDTWKVSDSIGRVAAVSDFAELAPGSISGLTAVSDAVSAGAWIDRSLKTLEAATMAGAA